MFQYNRINKIHERDLKCVYHQRNFEEFLQGENSFAIHEKIFRKLAVDMIKRNNITSDHSCRK